MLPSLPLHLLTCLLAQRWPLSFPLALAAFTLTLTTTLSSSPLPGLAWPCFNPCWPHSHPCHPHSHSCCLHPHPHCPHSHSYPCQQCSHSIPCWSCLHPSTMALGLIAHSPLLLPGTFVTLLALSFAHHWTHLHYGPLGLSHLSSYPSSPPDTSETSHPASTSPVSLVSPQMPPVAHRHGLIKVALAQQNQAPLRLLLSLMAMPQYPLLQNQRLLHQWLLPQLLLFHQPHTPPHSPNTLLGLDLTSIIGSASNTSQCIQTWTHQGHFSMVEPSPIEAPVIPHSHTSISTPVKTWPFPPLLTPLTLLAPLTPLIPHLATTHQHCW